MKKLLFSLAFIIIANISTFGQKSGDSYKMAENTVRELNDRMLITQEKKDSLILIFDKYYQDLKIAKSKDNEKFTKAIEQNRDLHVQMILSEFSYKEYQRYMDEQKNKTKGKEKDKLRHSERESTNLIDF